MISTKGIRGVNSYFKRASFFRFNGINTLESNFWLNIALFQKFIVIHHKEIKMKKFGFVTSVFAVIVMLFVVSPSSSQSSPTEELEGTLEIMVATNLRQKNVRLFTLLKWVKKEYRLTCQHARHPICRPDKNQNRRKVE